LKSELRSIIKFDFVRKQ